VTLGQFKDLAYAALADISGRGKLPLVTGGSGLYIHAVVKNYRIPEVTADPALRAELEARAERIGARAFHAELTAVDPKAAAKIHPNNVRRVVRALEVYRLTGEPISAQKGHGPRLYDFTVVGLRRGSEELYARIDERIQRMFERGWQSEVRRLLAEGVDPAWPSMAAIGYRELAAVEHGKMTLPEAVDRMQKTTRKFARHQKTWFTREDMPVHWVDAAAPDAAAQVEEYVAAAQNTP
jgi:tRNA dimethylallyltransferase